MMLLAPALAMIGVAGASLSYAMYPTKAKIGLLVFSSAALVFTLTIFAVSKLSG